jgi:hypothetical protein
MKRGRKPLKQAVVDYLTTGNGVSLAYFREPEGLYLGTYRDFPYSLVGFLLGNSSICKVRELLMVVRFVRS